MNDRYYYYIGSTNYYRNLILAESLIKEINGDLNSLLQVLSDASGSLINEMIEGVNILITQLTDYQNKASSIRSDLEANAVLFDTIYNNSKQFKGIVFEKGYMCDGLKTQYIISGTPRDYRHPKAYTYSYYLEDVYIDEKDNYPYKIFKTEYRGYEIKNPGIFQSVGFVDILQEKNRNPELDFSQTKKIKIELFNGIK